MISSGADASSTGGVNYESAPLVELEIDGTQYRVDAGKQGTALCISMRAAGTWTDWTFGGEARWDGSMLRAKAFERPVLASLATALRTALENAD
jgi:hypothetical protein